MDTSWIAKFYIQYEWVLSYIFAILVIWIAMKVLGENIKDVIKFIFLEVRELLGLKINRKTGNIMGGLLLFVMALTYKLDMASVARGLDSVVGTKASSVSGGVSWVELIQMVIIGLYFLGSVWICRTE